MNDGPENTAEAGSELDRTTSEALALVSRMRDGDREAAAEFISKYGTRIRRRVRGKLGPAMRRIFDSQDILSTLGRRLDDYVREGRVAAQSEDQFWSLVMTMARHAVIDKARICQRLHAVESDDARLASALRERLEREPSNGGAGATIQRAFEVLDDPVDQEILHLWLTGAPHSQTALAVNMTHAAVRKRWQIIRERLQERLDVEGP